MQHCDALHPASFQQFEGHLIFAFIYAYQAGASGLDVVAKTRELKKRHRAPHVMPDDQRKGTYRRMRRVRGGGAEQAGQEKEEEEEQVGQEGEEQEQEQGEPQEELEESLKGAVWKLVRDYIRHKTGGDPYECQHFFFDDLIEWSQKDKQCEGIEPGYIYNLLGRCGTLFSKDGNNISIEQICSSATEAEFLREANVDENDTQEDT